MNHVAAGKQAEDAATAFLQRRGCRIIGRNWRTRYCEIDIIAERRGSLYFCEVKYRLSGRQGSGLDYITAKKLRQMQFAAESWVHSHGWDGEYQLCAIEITGVSYQVTAAIKV